MFSVAGAASPELSCGAPAFRRSVPAPMFCRQACGFLDLAAIFVDRHVGFLARLKKPTCLCRKNSLQERKSLKTHMPVQKIEFRRLFCRQACGFFGPAAKNPRQGCGFLDLAIIFVDRHVGF